MIVRATGVSKQFGSRFAVRGLDLEVPAGTCFGLLGPNGAGKTTTLRMIYGVTAPSAGTIEVFGIDIARDSRAVRARLGVTLQENVLIDVLTPVENLRVFGRYHLLREPRLSQRIDELIDFLELRSHAGVAVAQLSGGFKRRLAIALSLMNEPELLILDEPTTGLDPAVRLALWGKIRDLRAAGTTILLTTHYMDEAQRLCDHIAVVADGRMLAEGVPAEMITSHLGAEAIEVVCPPEEEAALLAGFAAPLHKLRAGGRLMLYPNDAEALARHLRRRRDHERLQLVLRPANLEDLFLHLTGTSLEMGA
jgi:lipooligosaccharide transport system ATP-binding protein